MMCSCNKGGDSEGSEQQSYGGLIPHLTAEDIIKIGDLLNLEPRTVGDCEVYGDDESTN